LRLCSGCQSKLPDDHKGVCAQCKGAKQHRPEGMDAGVREHSFSDRDRYDFLYDSTRWKKLRRLAVTRHPFCARCPSVTEIIDHRVPAGVAIQQAHDSGRFPADRWAGFYLISNLQGLCRPCHYIKSKEDETHVGAWGSVLDVEDRTPKRKYTF